MGTGSNRIWDAAGGAFAALVVLFALAFVASEWIRFRRRKTPGYTGFISIRSTIRRIAGSVVLIVVALMFYAGLCVVNFARNPALFGVYWGLCSLLALLLFVLGLIDMRDVSDHRTAHHLKLLWRLSSRDMRK